MQAGGSAFRGAVELAVVGQDEGSALEGLGGLRAFQDGGAMRLFKGSEECAVERYDLVADPFSRNSGLLEPEALLKSSVVIVGVGSIGSFVALELARAGVGSFLLVDDDILMVHNLSRHQCGMADVGRYKAEAVAERIAEFNPLAEVEVERTILEDVPETVLDRHLLGRKGLIVACADNREGALAANRLSQHYRAPLVALGFWERAAAGEVFYSIPGETPCYRCMLRGDAVGGRGSRASRRFYTDQEDLEKVTFEPGISADISFVSAVGVKVILALLSEEDPARPDRPSRRRLLETLSQYTLVCNDNDPRVGGERVEIFDRPLQITTSIKVDFDPACAACDGGAKGGRDAVHR